MANVGAKSIYMNTQERLVSTDLNRMQKFVEQDLSQAVMRRTGMQVVGDYAWSPGVSQDPSNGTGTGTGYAPVIHRVLGGLLVRPLNPGYILIDSGSIGYFATPPSTDYSPWQVYDDAGVTSTTALVFTANTNSGTRIDIVECQPNTELTVLESSSRDVYNVATRQFGSATLSKVLKGTLKYRIRLGTAGGGIPLNDPDWVPLAMIVTRNDSTGFNTCDFYDVRPIVDPGISGHSPVSASAMSQTAFWQGSTLGGAGVMLYPPGLAHIDPASNVECVSTGGHAYTQGYWAANVGGTIVGGMLLKNTPATSLSAMGSYAAVVDLMDSDLYAASTYAASTTVGDRNVLDLLLPMQFLRIVKYTAAGYIVPGTSFAGRIPLGTNGILVRRKSINGEGDSPVTWWPDTAPWPASTPFGASTPAISVSIAEFPIVAPGVPCGFRAIGSSVRWSVKARNAANAQVTPCSTGFNDAYAVVPLQFTASTYATGAIPHGATSIVMRINFNPIFSTTTPVSWAYDIINVSCNPSSGYNADQEYSPDRLTTSNANTHTGVSVSAQVEETYKIPLLMNPMGISGQGVRSMSLVLQATANTPFLTGSTVTTYVMGYDR